VSISIEPVHAFDQKPFVIAKVNVLSVTDCGEPGFSLVNVVKGSLRDYRDDASYYAIKVIGTPKELCSRLN
jgi:hypothetical protein